jgi:hypothetical protein
MPRQTTYAGSLGDLTRFAAALDANAVELPHLEGPRGRLAQLLTLALDVAKQQAALKAGKQELSKELKRLTTESERMATGIRNLLKEHYGIRSEKLAEFGMQPFRGRPRNDGPEIPEPTEVPAPAGPSPTEPTN